MRRGAEESGFKLALKPVHCRSKRVTGGSGMACLVTPTVTGDISVTRLSVCLSVCLSRASCCSHGDENVREMDVMHVEKPGVWTTTTTRMHDDMFAS